MKRKVYTCLSGKEITFPIKVAGKVMYITFNGPNNQYKTSDVEVQKAIESEHLFKTGVIILTRGATVKADSEKESEKKTDPTSYPGIEGYQEAAEILRKEHNVAHQSVRTPEGILKKAQELNISFPDLK
jgi:hypothetical protein